MSWIEERWLCHKRLGHLNFDNIVKVNKNQNVREMPPLNKPENIIYKEC